MDKNESARKIALNTAEIDTLFVEEAVSFGFHDGVPRYRVQALFGEDATSYAFSPSKDSFRYINHFGLGEFQLEFALLPGFRLAAAWGNTEHIRDLLEGRAD